MDQQPKPDQNTSYEANVDENVEITEPVEADVTSSADAGTDALAAMTDQLQRLQAEFQNYIKRQERQAELAKKLAKKDLVVQLLDVLENLERALQSKDSGEGLVKGIEMVYQELGKILTSEGVHPIEALGKPFDPTYHEVLLTEKDETKDDGTIVEEFQRGYTLHGKVLRYSKVKITKGD